MSRARPAFLLLLGASLAVLPGLALLGAGPASASADRAAVSPGRKAVLVLVREVSFEQLLAFPDYGALARSGGAGLMTDRAGSGNRWAAAYETVLNGTVSDASTRGVPALYAALRAHGVRICLEEPLGPGGGFPGCLEAPGPALLVFDDTYPKPRVAPPPVESLVRGSTPTLLIGASIVPSPAMDRVGDQVTGIVMAERRPDRLFPARGSMHALTSNTTRFDGLVASVDVAPSVLDWFGIPAPSTMDGLPIRIVPGAPAPFGLHRLHLEQRRVRLPVDLGEIGFIGAVGLAGIAALVWLTKRDRLPARASAVLRFLVVAGVGFLLVVLEGGLLPRFTYAMVLPYLVLATAGLAALAIAARWRRPFGPFVFVGAVGLAGLVLDATVGGRALRMPLYGGTMFDGVRFYGLPNLFVAFLLASALFVAHALSRRAGFAVLFAAGLFAGFPGLGANIGAAAALLVAAVLWWWFRGQARRPLGLATAGVGAVAGMGLVFLANRLSSATPTHVTRFIHRGGGHLSYVFDTVRRRLDVGFGQFTHVPAAWIPIVGLPVVLMLALRGPGPIGRGLRPEPQWRSAIVALVLASVVAYLAADTGVAAAGPAFLYAMAMMIFPALVPAEASSQA